MSREGTPNDSDERLNCRKEWLGPDGRSLGVTVKLWQLSRVKPVKSYFTLEARDSCS